ncbi:MAG TPA: hypothetical protein V6D29_13225 [Leptolyngbyaceae cyanobacterium]
MKPLSSHSSLNSVAALEKEYGSLLRSLSPKIKISIVCALSEFVRFKQESALCDPLDMLFAEAVDLGEEATPPNRLYTILSELDEELCALASDAAVKEALALVAAISEALAWHS